MISVICVYNRPDDLDRCLKRSLDRQSAAHQRIFIDNSGGRFHSAASALNWGAARAEGEWLLFIHQDVHLPDPDWLLRAEKSLAEFGPELGWAGVAGQSSQDFAVGCIIDRAKLIGLPATVPRIVQTLDECLLFHRRRDGAPYFDMRLEGWHAYGVEACCQAILDGARNVVLPLLIHHESRSVNLAGLGEAHRYVWEKHGRNLGTIATTCGRLTRRPPPFRRISDRISWAVRRQTSQARAKFHRYRTVLYADVMVDELFEAGSEVHVWHAPLPSDPIEVGGFAPTTAKAKKVVHHFAGPGAPVAETVVVAQDLVDATPDLVELPEAWAYPSTLVVWSSGTALRSRPGLRRALDRHATDRVVNRFCCEPYRTETVHVIRNRR